MRKYTNEEIIKAIDSYIHSIRDSEILKRRLVNGEKFKDIAEDLHYSVRHIQRIVYKAENELFKHLK